MDVDGASTTLDEEDVPTCTFLPLPNSRRLTLLSDTSIEAPPSLLPPRHYCDITGLHVRLVSLCYTH